MSRKANLRSWKRSSTERLQQGPTPARSIASQRPCSETPSRVASLERQYCPKRPQRPQIHKPETSPAVLYAEAAERAGYRAWVNAPDSPGRESELFCLIHIDAAQRNYILHGFYPHELLAALGHPTSDSDLSLLQLTLALPFPVEDSALGEAARALHMLNLLVPLGQFTLSETEGLIAFRTILAHGQLAIEPAVVVEAIQMNRFFITRFALLVEALASVQHKAE